MRTTFVVLLFLCCCAASDVAAQSTVPAYKRNYVSGKSATVEKARSKLGATVDKMSTVKTVDEDLVKVEGNKYMPLYTTDLYKGGDGATYKSECRNIFLARYPKATIKSVVIPQTAWTTEEAVKSGTTIGYTQTLYCFIIAADGSGGYLNARFAYKRYKAVGGTYAPLAAVWPKWERADALTPSVYEKLLKK